MTKKQKGRVAAPLRAASEPRLHRRSLLSRSLAFCGLSSLSSFSLPAFGRGPKHEWGAQEINPTRHKLELLEKDYEALVIGSGFGGAVTALRLSQQFGDKVLIVERGKRYPKGSFARSPGGLIDSFWRQPGDGVPRPFSLPGAARGVFDLRSYKGMDTLVAAAYGGGSTIYAAALVEPRDPHFDKDWPASIKKENLAYYFDVFKKVMAARPVPQNEAKRRLLRHRLFKDASWATGGFFKEADVAIHFGNDFDQPDPMGQETLNAFGAEQSSCRYCAECVVGCNYQAKNTLDRNYLFVAEHKYKAEVRTEQQVEKIVPLNAAGEADPVADGSHGFHVYIRPLAEERPGFDYLVVKTKRVIVAAGVFGSNEILLRNKLLHKSLPRLSAQLGQAYSGNGDFINLVFGVKDDGSHFGPTVTLESTYRAGTFSKEQPSFILEDLAYPNQARFMSWLVQIFEPRTPLAKLLIGPLYQKILQSLQSDSSQSGRMSILLAVGIDKSDGAMTLGPKGQLLLAWRREASRELYASMIKLSEQIKRLWKAESVQPFPTYALGRNFTVHPLGGCALASSPDRGVVDADLSNFGAAFNYQNLYVADASMIPSALGANPVLTIGALAEMVAEGITGIRPTGDL